MRRPRNEFQVGQKKCTHPRTSVRGGRGSGWLGELETIGLVEMRVGGAPSRTPTSNPLPETLSKPIIWAKPGSIIPNGMAVIIWCEGTYRAIEYQLHFDGRLSTLERPNPPGITNKVKFSIRPMTSHTAGQYRCFYKKGELWSEPSDPLDLVVTGDVKDTSLAPTGQPSSDAREPSSFTTKVVGFQKGGTIWDQRADTVLRMGLMFLVLVALVCLLIEDWLRGKTTEERANEASNQECRVNFRTQRALDK
ncbi:natural cytotoxicity triggering receptor 1-like isoform X3 [Sturnira hondurensis]|uniref:natural cytotoxicity triggering receptor 1-like isoform X3 n=1 Tax=Sturnira hondurensis TaxID=192404 RepID=UPI001879FE00|nr:natural cytotoxicity triggering receptor 1-like isoform X3 [Sturnira hondurensis]